MNLGLHLKRTSMWFRDRTALIDGEKRFTFHQVNERVNRLANALTGLGLKKENRVALLSPNRHQLIEAEYACYKNGFVRVPLNARLSISELVHMLNDSEAHALIMGPEYVEDIEGAKSQIETVSHFLAISDGTPDMVDYEEILETGSAGEPNVSVELDDLANLAYTSGTSGVLKAAMTTHRNRIAMVKKHLFVPDMDIDRHSVMCHVGPVTHASGGMTLPIWLRGGCNVLLYGFDAKILFETIQRERVTHLFLVPTMINFLLADPNIKKHDLSSIRTILYGASPMPVERIKQALEIFGPVLIQGYGQTETSSGFTFLPKEDHVFEGDPIRLKRLSSAGIPNIEVDVRVVNENGDDVKPGEVGEIIEKGDDTMVGYWKAPELTAESIIDGWMHTRDMATVDEDGYIYIVDRKSDMIISGGFNIYPSEVENILHEHPAVFEAAVISVPDDKWGESVKAVVVLKEGMSVTEEELIEQCKSRLASFKKPRSVDFVNELPKNPYGKVLRRNLREKYWAEQDRMVH
ncbi:MAG: long-chain fatty acid--CoA ligase [Deltaproteobacteria bacterium]|nr:long-chain fatty acid--CoA ligase [Deltaproteobacteria bacterium]MBW1818934.1 long-chain fatty acid--CoA ligase [Deltaproteobacteria bacterium]